jgi:type VI secretion system ImpM family protein
MTPGLFGKMPAHGDFVRRGWDDATVDALDHWCSAIAASLDDADRDDRDAPVVFGRARGGRFGPLPLHLAVARSRDRAGRDFVLVVGVAGEGAYRPASLEDVLRAALSGASDADATVAAIPPGAGEADELTVDLSDAASVAAWLRERTAA